MGSADKMNQYKVGNSYLLAHRGLQPENTLYAFTKAFAAGFTVAECDVQVTKDGQFMLCHDSTLARTAQQAHDLNNQPISSVAYNDIAAIQVGDASHTEPLPLLQDLLTMLKADQQLLVEIKFSDTNAAPAFCELLSQYQQQVVVISFSLAMLQAVKQHAPQLASMLLTVNDSDDYGSIVINDAASLQYATEIVQQHQFSGLGLQYADYVIEVDLPRQMLTQLWYRECGPQAARSIINIAINKGFTYVNTDIILS